MDTERTTRTGTEPSKLLAIQAVAAGPEAAETKALALFNRYRKAAGLRPRSTTVGPEEPPMINQKEELEEAVGLRIYSLKPCRRGPRTAIITYEDPRSTPIIQAIIRKEGPIGISRATIEKERTHIMATFQTVDKCVCTIMKYIRWAATEEQDPRQRREPTPQAGPAMIPTSLEENRNAPMSPEPTNHGRCEARRVPTTEDENLNERRETTPMPRIMTDHEKWEARRVAEMRERQGKRLEHEEGLRIHLIIRTLAAKTTAILYFGRFGHINYFLTLPVDRNGVYQIFIKYFRVESADRELTEADSLYGVRRSNPPVVSDNIALLRYHPICRRNVNKKHYKNHEKIC